MFPHSVFFVLQFLYKKIFCQCHIFGFSIVKYGEEHFSYDKKTQMRSCKYVTKRERIQELDAYRALAIMAVLAIHATSEALAATIGSRAYPLYLLINTFSKFAVPVFIFLSGFVLFYNYADKPLSGGTIRQFYRKRLLYILVPYLVFSVFYYLLKLYRSDMLFDLSWAVAYDFIKALFGGRAYTHLYYIIIMVQFYILFPLLLAIFQKMRRAVPFMFLAAALLQWGFIIVNKYGWQIPRGNLAISYLSYFIFGAWIAMHYGSIRNWLVHLSKGYKQIVGWVVLWSVWIGLGIYHAYMFYRANVGKIFVNTLWYELVWYIHSLLSCIILIQIAFVLFYRCGRRISSWVTSIGACSFGIYLLHPFLLFIYRKIGIKGNMLEYALYIAGGWIFAFIGSWFIVYMISRVTSWSWIAFGIVPVQDKDSKSRIVDKPHHEANVRNLSE